MFYVLLVLLCSRAIQTDWMGGDGVQGPVANWGTQFWASESVTVATQGQASIIATNCNYTNWSKHIVDAGWGILGYAQGFMPADIDGDGIVDLVAHSRDSVVWYKHDGNYNFSHNSIGPADDSGNRWCPCIYPADIDGDGDIDVVVATIKKSVGVSWYENQLPTWVYHRVDSVNSYLRVSAADVENDGDMDIIAVDASGIQCGDIHLFRNNGSEVFTRTRIVDFSSARKGWRVYPADFNKDGYADIYSVGWDGAYVFRNNQAGGFSNYWGNDLWSSDDLDGGWPSDIDMDGDLDLVVSAIYQDGYFYALLNNGTATNFDTLRLEGTGGGAYGDGAIAMDIDLDGYPDIAGTYVDVGWFRQIPSAPLTFTQYLVDNSVSSSHWIYAYPLCKKCAPSIDLLVTDDQYHIVYQNNMLLGFASLGWLESSILELTPPYLAKCDLKYFGYNACVPDDSTLAFYWRTGMNASDLLTNPWNGPYYAKTGVNIRDSFALSGADWMFQYKVEFYGNPSDIAVLYEVWLDYECSGVGVEEQTIHTDTDVTLQFVNDNLIFYLPQADKIELAIYDIGGRLVKNVFSGYLPCGKYEFKIPLNSGIYFAKIKSSSIKQNKTLKVIKFK
ncbi:MAG: T9SS type A sorting domain-containing protein [Candidatus Stahlbacteria bacterium]|nr:T9SS type A sorting domain-containing protein [Candidatus Stahlbacteria bacterium]